MPTLPHDATVVALAVSLVWLIVLFGLYRRMSGETLVAKAKLPELKAQFAANLQPIREHDAEFKQNEFLAFVADSFKKIHYAVSVQDESLIEDIMEPHLFDEYKRTIQAHRVSKSQTIEKRLRIHGSAIRTAVTLMKSDCITVRLIFSSAVYEMDNQGNKSGDSKIRAWEEDWTFRRNLVDENYGPWRVSNIELVAKDRFGTQRSRSGSSVGIANTTVTV